ncbi:kelch-like protein 31 [Narcine bancroftii]|uniref:kelch-like protein 31 n=1 Tax=Narcine bancroftii TaxID=1343680 RepID=UPI003831FE9D
MAPKKKNIKKNKGENKETAVIVEESTIIHLSGVNGLLDGGNGFSCISTEISNSFHSSSLLEAINRMRQENFLCDLTISTKTKSFEVHKVVMASFSEYFKNILKKDPSTQRIDLSEISPVGLLTVITYAYCGTITLSLYTIASTIATANLLQIHSLLKMCCDFLIQEINVENCMYIANIAETYGLKNTKEAVHKFIIENFLEFSERDQFLKLTFEQIMEFMMDDALQLPSEIAAFQIAMKWLDFDNKRIKYAADLLNTIRFGTISAQDLVNYVQTVPRMMQDLECHKFLVEAMNYHLLPFQQNTLQSRRTKVRSGLKVLVIVGGRQELTEKSLSRDVVYRDPERVWNKLSEVPYKTFNQCVAVMDGFLYVAGGEDQNDARNQAKHAVSNFCRYDPRFNTWIHLSSMTHRRTHFSLNVFNGLIFAIGGRNADGLLASVECYVPATNKWHLKVTLEVPRCCHASAVIDGKILVTGGYINNAYSRLVSAYDLSADSWQDAANLSTPRGWHCAISLLDRVYVLGGSQLGGRGERIDVLPVECYNARTGQWCYAAPLPVGVSTAGITNLDNKIYLVAGWNEAEKKYKKCIQCFNPDLNEWTDEEVLPEGIVGLSCCVFTMPRQKTRESRTSSVSSVPVSI